MTINYLKDLSAMLAVVSVVREVGLKRHFTAERDILKLMFASDHIDYVRHNTYHQIYLNYLLRWRKSIAKDL